MTQTITTVTLEMRTKLMINGQPATEEEYRRVMNAKPKKLLPYRGTLNNSNRGFSLMK
jgi:hypothetical protein